MWVISQGPLGGVMKLPDMARKNGAPPHWMAHVEVADADATVAKARSLDGTLVHGPEDIADVGRFAILGDPQGAMLSVFTPKQAMTMHATTSTAEFCWNELVTSDQNAGFRFYSALFGWEKIQEHDMGPMGSISSSESAGSRWAGCSRLPKGAVMPPHFGGTTPG